MKAKSEGSTHPGSVDPVADLLSRHRLRHGEWSSHHQTVNLIW